MSDSGAAKHSSALLLSYEFVLLIMFNFDTGKTRKNISDAVRRELTT